MCRSSHNPQRSDIRDKDRRGCRVYLHHARKLSRSDRKSDSSENFEKEVMKMSAEFRNPIYYRRLNDAVGLPAPARRSLDDVVRIINELHADFIMHGVHRHRPRPNTCDEIPSESERKRCRETGASYKLMREAVNFVRRKTKAKIGGGTNFQYFWAENLAQEGEYWSWLGRDETWELALDPRDHGIPISKEKLHKLFARRLGLKVKDPKKELDFYIPDPTKDEVQEIYRNILEAQVDCCRIDAFHWDMIFIPVTTLLRLGVPVTHQGLKEIYHGCLNLIDWTRRKVRWYIQWGFHKLEQQFKLFSKLGAPSIDIAMTTISVEEIRRRQINRERWRNVKEIIHRIYGDVEHFARIDYGFGTTPLYVFAEELSPLEQRKFLIEADEALRKMNVLLILPVHGGNPCDERQIRKGRCPRRAYGRYNWYDSLAPEFFTYDAIKTIALRRVCRRVCRTVYEWRREHIPRRICRWETRTIERVEWRWRCKRIGRLSYICRRVPVRVRRKARVRICRTIYVPVWRRRQRRVCKVVCK